MVPKLTSAAFIVCLHRLTVVLGKLTTIWSDLSTNFVGAAIELKDLYIHLGDTQPVHAIGKFCADQGIQ